MSREQETEDSHHYECIACLQGDAETPFSTFSKQEMRKHQYNKHDLTELMDAAVEVT